MSQKSFFTKNSIQKLIEETLIYVKEKNNADVNKKDLVDYLFSKNIINQSIYDHIIQKPKETCHALVKKKNRCHHLTCDEGIFCTFHTINKPTLTYEQFMNINSIKDETN